MYKFILVSSEVEGHSSASAIIASNEKTEQEFRHEFLFYEGNPIAELSSRTIEGDTTVEYYKDIVFCSGDFSISTTLFNDLKDIQNRMFETCTG